MIGDFCILTDWYLNACTVVPVKLKPIKLQQEIETSNTQEKF